MTDSDTSLRRRPGAPLGNRNAVKHGFYARRLPAADGDTPSAELSLANSLNGEIAMLRLSVRNILEQSATPSDTATELEVLRSVCMAAAAINRLLRTQHFLRSGENPLMDLFREVLAEVKRKNSEKILDNLEPGS